MLEIYSRLLRLDERPEVFLGDLCRRLSSKLEYPLVWVALAAIDDTALQVRAAGGNFLQSDFVGTILRSTDGVRGLSTTLRCFRMGHTVVTRDARAELPWRNASRALAAMPLIVDGKTIGTLCVEAASGYHFRQNEIDFLESISNVTGTALRAFDRLAEADRMVAHHLEATAVFESAMEGIFITDRDSRILAANPAVCRISGYSENELLGATPSIFSSGRHDQAFYDKFRRVLDDRGSWRGEIWNRRKNGEVYPELLCVSAVHDAGGAVCRYIALLVDISVQKKVETELSYKAHHDELTGLLNRNGFQSSLEQILDKARRGDGRAAVVLVDLDDFKYVNETLGHHHGDALIRIMADRLAGCLRSEDVLARLGGDGFVVVLAGLIHMHDAAIATRKLLDRIAEPTVIGDCEVWLTGSAGIAVYPEDGDLPEVLLRHADSAMYGAKGQGNDTMVFYHAEMDLHSSEQLALGGALKSALPRDEFFLVYQPQVDLTKPGVVGVEALVRWNRNGELISPSRFIPMAERSGLIVRIGRWILLEACRQGQRWRDRGIIEFRMSVNLSARQFHERNLLPMIRDVLEETGFPADCLEIEITETVAMGNPVNTVLVLDALKKLGVTIAIDDFGTGHSSLAYLGRYPLDRLKLDGSFVQAIGSDHSMETIVLAVVAMGEKLELTVIAEGVETPAQAAFLQNAGCPLAQGYLFGRPMTHEAFEVWLQQYPERTTCNRVQPSSAGGSTPGSGQVAPIGGGRSR